MSLPSPFLINSFGYFAATELKCFWPFNCKKLPSVKPKLNSAMGLDFAN